jgi:hypothetical protein
MQTEVNEARGLNFAKAARHLLRQDPQVLVIGESRARTWRSGDANWSCRKDPGNPVACGRCSPSSPSRLPIHPNEHRLSIHKPRPNSTPPGRHGGHPHARAAVHHPHLSRRKSAFALQPRTRIKAHGTRPDPPASKQPSHRCSRPRTRGSNRRNSQVVSWRSGDIRVQRLVLRTQSRSVRRWTAAVSAEDQPQRARPIHTRNRPSGAIHLLTRCG